MKRLGQNILRKRDSPPNPQTLSAMFECCPPRAPLRGQAARGDNLLSPPVNIIMIILRPIGHFVADLVRRRRPSRAVSSLGYAPASAPAAGATDTLARRRTRSREVSTSQFTMGIPAIYGPFLPLQIFDAAPRRDIDISSCFLRGCAFRPPVPRECRPPWRHRYRGGLCGRP